MPLSLLVGLELTEVVFSGDHLRLVLGEATLTCYVWPRVDLGETERAFGDDGYRDDLCLLLGSVVRDVRESWLSGLTLDLGVGRVVVDPEPGDLMGPEIAVLTSGDTLTVWRPDTPPFDERAWP